MVGSINKTASTMQSRSIRVMVFFREVISCIPTMTVSVILTPMVIMLCKEIGMAITAIFL